MAKKAAPKKAAKKQTARAKPKTAARASWSVAEILKQLESMSDPKMRAHYLKYGATENQFGVKLGDIRKLADKIKPDHELALALWEHGNAEARLLATLALKPDRLSADEMDLMVRSVASLHRGDVTFSHVGDWLHSYVVKDHPDHEALRVRWMASDDKWAARAGWRLTAGRVAKNPAGLDVKALLDRLEQEMGGAPPEVQWTMNMCLAEIGINFPAHRKRAIAIGEKLGVYRDYPVSKGCTSPFAPIWIDAMVKRQK